MWKRNSTPNRHLIHISAAKSLKSSSNSVVLLSLDLPTVFTNFSATDRRPSIAQPMATRALRFGLRCFTSSRAPHTTAPFRAILSSSPTKPDLRFWKTPPLSRPPWAVAVPVWNHHFHSLTDTRFPKRRPSDKPRRKRASLRPSGPYAWVQYSPGEPILPNNPNQGSVKRRNEKKRIRQRRAFILSERKKRKAQLQEAKRKKNIKRVERKMAAVAREREWAERLAELQQLEQEKKKCMA